MTSSRFSVSLTLLFLPGLFFFQALPAAAQPNGEFSPQQAKAVLEKLKSSMLKEKPAVEALSASLKQVTGIIEQGQDCVSSSQKELEGVDESLEAVGDKIPGESVAMTRERKTLLREKNTLEKRMAECRLLVLEAEDVSATINTQWQQLLGRQLVFRRADAVSLLVANIKNGGQAAKAVKDFVVLQSGLERLGPGLLALLCGVSLLGGGVGLWLRHVLRRLAEARRGEGCAERLAQAALDSTAGHMPLFLLLASFAVCLALLSRGVEPPPYLPTLAVALLVYLVCRAVIRLLFKPCPPAGRFTGWPERLANRVARRLSSMAGLIVLAFLLFATPFFKGLPEQLNQLIHTAYITVFCLFLFWFLKPVPSIPGFEKYGARLRTCFVVVLPVVLGIELLGYENLSVYLLRALAGTLALAAALLVVQFQFGEILQGLAYGGRDWQNRFRRKIGVADKKVVQSFLWLHYIVRFLLWFAFALFFVRLWRMPGTYVAALLSYFTKGFLIGRIEIVPLRLLLGIMTFTALWTASSWFKGELEKKLLAGVKVAASARDAMITFTGYAGFILAILIGLSIAGVDFTGLAVIAGALSVGIGFGLQNIVNNFVSGLILLFERPIKRGDWIRVGDTEGYVRKISVRSTVIQTFDRADVIVPNSELIATQVTNLMLEDRLGRVRVPVGVAYGSDTQLIKRLLLEVANNHPKVVTEEGTLEAKAYFIGFGDSSLDFELRCYLRDIDQQFQVRSDLNFGIDAAFREHGVEIPFPQRDVHLKDIPPGAGKASPQGEE